MRPPENAVVYELITMIVHLRGVITKCLTFDYRPTIMRRIDNLGG